MPAHSNWQHISWLNSKTAAFLKSCQTFYFLQWKKGENQQHKRFTGLSRSSIEKLCVLGAWRNEGLNLSFFLVNCSNRAPCRSGLLALLHSEALVLKDQGYGFPSVTSAVHLFCFDATAVWLLRFLSNLRRCRLAALFTYWIMGSRASVFAFDSSGFKLGGKGNNCMCFGRTIKEN